jgi:hypothetical protein
MHPRERMIQAEESLREAGVGEGLSVELPLWVKAVALTFPGWGAVLVVAASELLPKASFLQSLLMPVGIVCFLASAFPIALSKNSTGTKIVLTVFYFILTFWVALFCGWAAIGYWHPNMH